MTIKEAYKKNRESLFELFGKTYFQDVTSLFQMFIALILLLAIVLLILFRIKPSESLVPLVYNSTFGATDLGAWYKIYFYPLAFGCFSLLNFLVAWAYFEKKRLITYLVLFVHNLIGLILLIEVYYLTVLIRG